MGPWTACRPRLWALHHRSMVDRGARRTTACGGAEAAAVAPWLAPVSLPRRRYAARAGRAERGECDACDDSSGEGPACAGHAAGVARRRRASPTSPWDAQRGRGHARIAPVRLSCTRGSRGMLTFMDAAAGRRDRRRPTKTSVESCLS